MHPQHLAAVVLKALKERNGINTAEVDDVIWGTSAQKGKQGGDMGRMAALDAGYDVRASGVTLDRFCGSGLTAASLAAAQIKSGMEDLIVAGGTEMMSLITTLGRRGTSCWIQVARHRHRQSAAARASSAITSRRLRRCYRVDGRHRSRSAGCILAREPAARGSRDQGRSVRSFHRAGRG